MKKNLFILLLAALLTLALTATAEVSLPSALTTIEDSVFEDDVALDGRVTLPSGVKTVGSRAFAGTGLHALVLPSGCKTVDGSVLADTRAAYLYLKGASTAISGSLEDVAYVFGPAFGSASDLNNFYATETLVTNAGFYYSVTDGSAAPLCAVDGTAISTSITIPKLVNDQPVRSLSTLVVNGCTSLSTINIPGYLTAPSSLDATTYVTMTVEAPVPSAASAKVGDTLTWTTSTSGDYGEVTYEWTFNTDGVTHTIVTAEPTLEYTLKDAGFCVVTVTATDELGDTASATADALTVEGDGSTVYRALGQEGDIKVEAREEPLPPGHHAFLLCSDGFWEYVLEAEMEEDLKTAADPEEWLQKMRARLKQRVPADNDNNTAAVLWLD